MAVARSIWQGSISFGLVNIPVSLAVGASKNDLSFRTLHQECGTPIKQKRYCPTHEVDVESDSLVKGWEVSKGEFVMVNEDDLDALAPEKSRAIEVEDFVDLAEVDPQLFDRTYYLVPSVEDKQQRRGYVMLRQALEQTGRAAVAKFILWGKENLCVIRPVGETLVLHTLFYAEDIRSHSSIDELVEGVEASDAEVTMAILVIDNLVAPFEHDRYVNEHRMRIQEYVSALAQGERPALPEAAAKTPAGDLMAQLKASIAASDKPKKKAAPRKKKDVAKA